MLFALSACEAPVTHITQTTVNVIEIESGVNEVKLFLIDREDAYESYKSVIKEKYEPMGIYDVGRKGFSFDLEDVPSNQCVYVRITKKEGVGEALAIAMSYWTTPEFRFTEGQTELRWDLHLMFSDNRKTNKDK